VAGRAVDLTERAVQHSSQGCHGMLSAASLCLHSFLLAVLPRRRRLPTRSGVSGARSEAAQSKRRTGVRGAQYEHLGGTSAHPAHARW
jgi:hypothetical protein